MPQRAGQRALSAQAEETFPQEQGREKENPATPTLSFSFRRHFDAVM
jgi:hypothetical protein